MRGVQGDKAHPLQHLLLHERGNRVGHLAVAHMPPPDQHVNAVKKCLGKAAVFLAERRGQHLVAFRAQKCGDGVVDTVGIDVVHLFVLEFVSVFVPNENFHMKDPLFLFFFYFIIKAPTVQVI